MKHLTKLSAIIFTILLTSNTKALANRVAFQDTLKVNKVSPFEIDGAGSHPSWNNTSWINLIQLDSSSLDYPSKFKIFKREWSCYFN